MDNELKSVGGFLSVGHFFNSSGFGFIANSKRLKALLQN